MQDRGQAERCPARVSADWACLGGSLVERLASGNVRILRVCNRLIIPDTGSFLPDYEAMENAGKCEKKEESGNWKGDLKWLRG